MGTFAFLAISTLCCQEVVGDFFNRSALVQCANVNLFVRNWYNCRVVPEIERIGHVTPPFQSDLTTAMQQLQSPPEEIKSEMFYTADDAEGYRPSDPVRIVVS
jgi:hypothetical protein